MSALLSFQAVAPIFILIGLGFLLRKLNLLNNDVIKKMSTLAFTFFLPVMVFEKLYKSEISQVINIPIIIFSIFFVVSIFLLSLLIVPRIEKEDAKRSVLIQGWFRGYTLLFGFPIITTLYGSNSLALLSVVLAVTVPIRNAEAVIVLEMYGGCKNSLKGILIKILRNPLLIASVIGIGAMIINLKLPYIIEKPINDISGVATPFSLLLLGGFINFSTLKKNAKQIILGVGVKLIVIPIIFMGAAILLGFRGIELATLLALCCVPVGSGTFIMSQQMGGDAKLAAELVIVGTLVSSVTIFLWIFVLNNLALI